MPITCHGRTIHWVVEPAWPSAVDLTNGYMQIPRDDETSKPTIASSTCWPVTVYGDDFCVCVRPTPPYSCSWTSPLRGLVDCIVVSVY